MASFGGSLMRLVCGLYCFSLAVVPGILASTGIPPEEVASDEQVRALVKALDGGKLRPREASKVFDTLIG
jgi:hypothetical protein